RALAERERELPIFGHIHASLDGHDVTDIEVEDAIVSLLPERVYPDHSLDRTGKVADVQERGLSVPPPGDYPARDLVAQVRVLARVERGGIMGCKHVGDARALGPQR